MYTPRVYLTFWGYKRAGDPDAVKPVLVDFLRNVGGTPWLATVIQYYGKDGSIENPTGLLAGIWEDEHDKIPDVPTTAQLGAEAVRSAEHFGYDADASYVIATAHDHNAAGFGTAWCGWHAAALMGQNWVSYTNLPYAPDVSNCGANYIRNAPKDEPAVDEGVTIIEGHELAESITDARPTSGWSNATYGEIADECAWTDIRFEPIGQFLYTTQPLFSNASASCVQSYP